MDFDRETPIKGMARLGTGYTVSHGLLRLVSLTIFLYLILAYKLEVINLYSFHNFSFSGMGDGGRGHFDRWVWQQITAYIA